MNDEKPDDSVVKEITDYVPKSKRRQSHVPRSKRNQDARESRSPTVREVREWITAGSLAAGQKLYTQLAQQHKDTFEIQEAAFMAVVEGLHARLCTLEESQGIASPELATLRAALEDAVVEFQNGGPIEDETDAAGPCTHDRVTEGNPATCMACGETVSVRVGPRVDDPDAALIETVRNALGERWNTLTIVQRREAVRVYQEAEATNGQSPG